MKKKIPPSHQKLKKEKKKKTCPQTKKQTGAGKMSLQVEHLSAPQCDQNCITGTQGKE